MGFLDFLFPKKEPIKTSSSPVKKATVSRATSSQKTKKPPLKVTDNAVIENNLQLQTQPETVEIDFYCPIRKAKIFCHAVVVDKLGDLTKFIISSLYTGHSIEEISALTQMGNTTVKEELQYLIRGGLVNGDQSTLTVLGMQYGKLLEIFKKLSDGVEVAFNTFANLFEALEEDKYEKQPDHNYVLADHFIPALSRNDDYANSLEMALSYVESGVPFYPEIKNSLYATVKIERENIGYKRVRIKDLSKGLISTDEPCVTIAIPYDRVFYKPRYTWLNPYREVLSVVGRIGEDFPDLLSEKANLLVSTAKEEDDSKKVIRDINTVTGSIDRERDDLAEVPLDKSIFVLERKSVQLKLNKEVGKGIFLEELERKQLYQIRCFPYKRMEVE